MDYMKLLPSGLDKEQKKKAQIRIERYLKKYPDKDIRKFIDKINAELNLENTKQALISEIQKRENQNNKQTIEYAKQSILNGKYAQKLLQGNRYPFARLEEFIAKNKANQMTLYHNDFRETNIKKQSVDLIVTDPPYPKKYIGLYRDLALFALKVLKSGGSLFAMAGQSYLPEILKQMEVDGLNYNWTLAYLTPGGQSPQLWQRKVNTFWKPVLWYIKGKPDKWMGDVVKSNVNDNDKAFHFWGQSISGMSDLIDRVSYMGETVLDPFMGGGTTGAVCLMQRRKFIGIELDKEVFETAKSRLKLLGKELEG
ncbi:MAG: site-specific DNA-methyltransferase [Bacteroidota bacterium]|nr:site-specific DNA-methyltransferase [Bacteroidota bacterium]